MTPTTLTNLALSRIGHTLVKALGDTTSKDARLASLHYEPCLREALRAHFWSFAMTTRPLVAVDVREYLDVSGPLKVGGTSLTFPRLYLQEGEVDGKAHYQESPDADSEAAVSGAYWDAAEAEWVLEHGPLAAEWRRGLDVESPERITLRPFSPRPFLETKLAGDHNDLRFEQVDHGNTLPISVEYSTPTATHLCTCAVTGRALLITPGSMALMIVTGFADGLNGANQNYLYTDLLNNRPRYVGSSGFEIVWSGSTWHISRNTPWPPVSFASSSDDVATPNLVTTWVPGAGTAPSARAGVSSAAQVAAAIAGNVDAAALITVANKAGSNGTGPVTMMPKASLSGGVTGTPVMRRVTPGTELTGWSHAFELPADFIKAKALYPVSGARRIDQFAIRRVSGKTCILCNCDAVSLEYVQYVNDPASFDPLFVKAFTTLLAAKLARAISGSDDLESRFLQIFETVDLPAARTASGHETDSDENHPLRALLDGTLTPGRGDFFPRTTPTVGGASSPSQTSPIYQTITFDTEAEQVVIRKGGKTIRINGIVDP